MLPYISLCLKPSDVNGLGKFRDLPTSSILRPMFLLEHTMYALLSVVLIPIILGAGTSAQRQKLPSMCCRHGIMAAQEYGTHLGGGMEPIA
jgi:hypothetical protein